MRHGLTLMVVLVGALAAACDYGSNDAALTGSWLRMRTPSEMRDQYIFRDDGTFEFNEHKPGEPQNEDHIVGTYVADGNVVTVTANDQAGRRSRLSFSYYADRSQFSSAALHAPSGHTGPVGVWTGVRRVELLDGTDAPTGGEIHVEIRADGTYRWTVTPFDGTAAIVEDGTWMTGTEGNIQQTASNGASRALRLLGDQALVDEPRIWRRWKPD